MRNLSPEESKFLMDLGFKALLLLGKSIATIHAKGVDLEKLMQEARERNDIDFDDLIKKE